MKSIQIIQALVLVVFMSVTARAFHITPSGGIVSSPLAVGSDVVVQWLPSDVEGMESVDVLLWDGYTSDLQMIAEAVNPSVGEAAWVVPGTIVPGDRYRFVVRDAANTRRFRMSDGWVPLGIPQPVSTQEEGPDTGSDVSVHPFPAMTSVRVGWEDREIRRLQVVNMNNEVVMEQDVSLSASTTQLNVRAVPSGLYHVKLIDVRGNIVSHPMMVTR
jgi:hypothetical protein